MSGFNFARRQGLTSAPLCRFTGYLLTQPSFTWQIYGVGLSISALGITVDGKCVISPG